MVKKVVIEKEELLELYTNQRKSTKEIANIYNTSTKTVRMRLHEYNIPVRQSNEINRKYTFDECYFNTIDTQSKAYILGLISSDGWVANNRFGTPALVGISFQERDGEVIDFIKQELQCPNHSEHKKVGHRGVSFSSTKMAKKLCEYGIVPNKSTIINMEEVVKLANIPEHLVPSFLLGVYDGDGGIYSCLGKNQKTVQWTMGITGTLPTCKFLKEYFNCGHIVDEETNCGAIYTFKLAGRNQGVNGLSKLYDNHNSFYFKRKYNKFLDAKSPTIQQYLVKRN